MKVTTIIRPGKLCAGCKYVKTWRHSHYCQECSVIVKMIQVDVSKAVKASRMPEGTKCVDCGRGAQVRDHRRYADPRAIEYVCRTCNSLRGPALDISEMVTKYKRFISATRPVDKRCGQVVDWRHAIANTPRTRANSGEPVE